MSQSEPFVLSDKNIKPDDDLVFSLIGDNSSLWMELMAFLGSAYKDFSGDWNWYNDGKQWLFRMTQKKKTVFWLGLREGTFRITFYFGDKAESLIFSSTLPMNLIDDFRTGKRYGRIRALALNINDQSDLESVKKIVEIKLKMK